MARLTAIRVLVGLGLFLSVGPVSADTMTLQNGSVVTPYSALYPNDTYNYSGCQDAMIDPAQPSANFGRRQEQGLAGGTGRKMLIRFGDLHRAIGPGKQITGASLKLHTVSGAWTTGNTVSVYRLLVPWRQGSMDVSPQAQHWACSWDYRLYSANPAETLAWASSGASGSGTDRSTGGPITDTTTNYNSTARTWQIDGLTADVAAWYANHARNFGWVIEYTVPDVGSGTNSFYSSESQTVSLRPELIITYTNEAVAPSRAIDLDVTYIDRTPEYYRYNPNAYEYKTFHDESTGILKNPGYAATQKWPNNGQAVTFTAHVKNKGTTTGTGSFKYRWFINGVVVSTGLDVTGIAPGAEQTYTYTWTWDANDYLNDTNLHRKSTDHRDRTVTFEVDYNELVTEQSENNNSLTQYIEAPAMGFYVEQSFYNLFNNTRNQTGSYSFEAWLNWVVQVWNDSYLEMSRFESFAEDGSLERICVQKVQVVADNTLAGGNHVPGGATNYLIDGEWGFEYDAANSPGYVDKFSKIIEGGLLHECTHQMGLIDLYAMNMEAGTPSTPSKVKVKDGGAYYITRGYYPSFMGLMAGDDTRYNPSYEATGLLEDWTLGAFNTNVGYRRGFYGEELYDLPQTVKLRALDATDAPLPYAAVTIWQSSGGNTSETNSGGTPYTWQPTYQGTADAQGVVTLPNVGTLEAGPVTTLTGHTLRDNPWGRVNVVGTNGSFLIKVAAHGQQDYDFRRVTEANRACWKGQTAEYTYDVRAQICPRVVSTVNIALGKSATSNAGGGPSYAVDGNVNTRWDPGNAPVNAYIQVNLGANYDVAKVVLFQNGWGGDFFQKFRIETSTTGIFTGGQTLFARESLGWGRTVSDRRDMDPADAEQDALWVTYAGTPNPARYIRITAEQGNWTKLAELRIYESTGYTRPTALAAGIQTPVNAPVDITLQGTSAYAAPLDYRIWSLPTHGILRDPGAGLIASVPYTMVNGGQVARYIPDPGYSGTDSFAFEVIDNIPSLPATVSITVGGVEPVYAFPMDVNPAWTTEGQWAFGQPTGGGGQRGRPDPTSGHTGNNVYGYNLSGDYANSLPETHLTSLALDCTGVTQVSLRFWRWLGVEAPKADHAYVRVSTNGTSWTTVWQNSAEVTDSVWTYQELNISAVANNQPTLYLRWTMGATDASLHYCGWNIDDVELWGAVTYQPPAGDLDGDGDTDLADYVIFEECLTGPGGGVPYGCEWADLDGDTDVDAQDYGRFQAAQEPGI